MAAVPNNSYTKHKTCAKGRSDKREQRMQRVSATENLLMCFSDGKPSPSHSNQEDFGYTAKTVCPLPAIIKP
jgi:hypothetical protein